MFVQCYKLNTRKMFGISSGLYKVTYVCKLCISYFIAFSTVVVSFWIRSGEKSFAGWNLTVVGCGTQCRCTVIYFFYRQLTTQAREIVSNDEVKKKFNLSSGVFQIAKGSCSIFSVNSRTTKRGYELSHKLFNFFFN